MTSRRAVLTGIIAAAAAPAAAGAQPSELDRLLAAHQVALAEYDAATEAYEGLSHLGMDCPQVHVGNRLDLRTGERSPIYCSSPEEIVRHFSAYLSCSDGGMPGVRRLRDAKLAELEPLHTAYEERLATSGYFAAQERVAAAGRALVAAEDAIIDHRPVTMAEVAAKARFLLSYPGFEDEVFARQFARSLVGIEEFPS